MPASRAASVWAIAFDDLPDQPARLDHQARATATPGADRLAEHAQAGRDVGRQAIHAHQDAQPGGTRADLLHQRHDQLRVAVGADHSTQPQAARDRQGHGQPGPLADQLDPQFVSLDVLQIHLSLLDQVLVDRLAVLAGALQPGGYRPLIEHERGDNRLHRAAVAEQDQHHDQQAQRAVHAVQRGAPRGGKRAATHRAAVAPLLLTVHPDGALPGLATGGAVPVRAELTLRVHRRSPIDMRGYSRLTGEPVGPLRCLPQPATTPTTVPCSATVYA